MGYLSIPNLYKDTRILKFKEVYALEKCEGTSAHIFWCAEQKFLHFSAGGASQQLFEQLFDKEALTNYLSGFGTNIYIYGEAYGGKIQRMSESYGKDLRFIAFDVRINNCWLDVPNAADIVVNAGLEFVPYIYCTTDLCTLDAARDADSDIAARRGFMQRKREGIVIRPPFEVTLNNGDRLIAKHKRADFRETRTERVVGDTVAILQEANAIALEWVTTERLKHVLQTIPEPHTMADTGKVINAMIADVLKESTGEIVDSREARKAIGAAAVKMYKEWLREQS